MSDNFVRPAVLLAGFLSLAIRSVAVEAATTPSGTPCVLQESQSWWMTTPGKSGTQSGHVHIGACMPWGKKLAASSRYQLL